MNCKTAIELDLIKVLASLNYYPAKQIKNDLWYYSPFRKERTPSFKVSSKINRWYDHSIGEGGDVITLIVRLKKYTITEALNFLRALNLSDSFSFQQQSILTRSQDSKLKIKKLSEIRNPVLIGYLKSRKININEALKYCKEIYYTKGDIKTFFGIGFKNDTDGFEFSNKYFKSCLINKNITTILNGSDTLLVFEGFIDFLSYRSLKLTELMEDYVILNSTSLVCQSITLLQKYKVIKTYLDNDNSGKKATLIIKNNCKTKFENCSDLYRNYKDLNEYLMAHGK